LEADSGIEPATRSGYYYFEYIRNKQSWDFWRGGEGKVADETSAGYEVDVHQRRQKK
jgi:hypothetical protein